MNLAPVSVEHSHGDCAGHPGHVRDKFERAHAASRVGAQFPNDIAKPSRYWIRYCTLEILALKHPGRWIGGYTPAALRIAVKTSTAASPDWRPPRDENNCRPPAVRGRCAPSYRRS